MTITQGFPWNVYISRQTLLTIFLGILNIPIPTREIVGKNLATKKIPSPDGSTEDLQ